MGKGWKKQQKMQAGEKYIVYVLASLESTGDDGHAHWAFPPHGPAAKSASRGPTEKDPEGTIDDRILDAVEETLVEPLEEDETEE